MFIEHLNGTFGTPRPIPRNQDLGCTLRGYFGHMLIMSLNPCQLNNMDYYNETCIGLQYFMINIIERKLL